MSEYAITQRLGMKILQRGEEDIRVALAGSSTMDTIAPALAVACYNTGIYPRIYVDGFNLYQAHITNTSSPLYESNPDIVFLSIDIYSLSPLLPDACDKLVSLIETFKTHTSALLVIHNFLLPVGFPFSTTNNLMEKHIYAINGWLFDTYQDDPQVHILDFESLCAYHGKSRIVSPKLYYMGGIAVSETFLPVLAQQYLAYIKAYLGLTRKCIVLDCDGTLWGGVIGEDGIDNIQLAKDGPYYNFQRSILALYQRGIILALNSKNNPNDVLNVLRNHPNMVLREDHFASLQINWKDKVTNTRAITDELNIGLNSLVFIDDNPRERQWVSQSLPEVLVVDLPDNPVFYADVLGNLTDFEVLTLTDEDRRRGEMYAVERQRKELQESILTYDEYLDSLKIEITVERCQEKDIPRVGQLTRKTNQFNMTTRRYTDVSIADMVADPDIFVYMLRVKDIFGDSGLVGVAIIKDHEIDTFLLSCRVLGKRIEHAFLTEVLRDCGIDRVTARFVPTPKNASAADFYSEYGFVESGDTWRWQNVS